MKHDLILTLPLRDYHWLLDSPDLLPDGYDIAAKEPKQNERQAPATAAGLMPFISGPFLSGKGRARLGHYVENLLAFALERDPRISDLARNIQVIAEKRTVGEFDFLFRRREGACHLEVAIKFYLGSGDLTRPENWLGPNCHDRLSLKLDKMFHKQLRLSQTPAGRDCLTQLGYGEVTPRHLLKGMLFYPYEHWRNGLFRHPAALSPDHRKGWWAPQNRAAEILATAEYWTILNKPHWLSAARRPQEAEILSGPDLRRRLGRHFRATKSPLLVAALADSADPDVTPCPERHRGFITPPDWPYPPARPTA